MNRSKKSGPWRLITGFVVGVLVASIVLVSAPEIALGEEYASLAMCAYILGDRHSGDDSAIHNIAYPGQNANVDRGEDNFFVNCNPRNFMVNDGTYYHLDGHPIGDRFVTIEFTVPESGVRGRLSLSAYFMLNQGYEAMKAFWASCYKYHCYTDEDTSGELNYSSPGWNGLLGENFGPALARAARRASFAPNPDDPTQVITDDIWQLEDPAQFDLLANGISYYLGDELRKTVGFSEPLFCDSETSGWTDPNNRGKDGTFNCLPIRISVDDVQLSPDCEQSPKGLETLNHLRRDNAEILYGDSTDEALAQQDLVNTCGNSGGEPIVVVGGTGNVSVAPASDIEQPAQTPVPTPTPEEEE